MNLSYFLKSNHYREHIILKYLCKNGRAILFLALTNEDSNLRKIIIEWIKWNKAIEVKRTYIGITNLIGNKFAKYICSFGSLKFLQYFVDKSLIQIHKDDDQMLWHTIKATARTRKNDNDHDVSLIKFLWSHGIKCKHGDCISDRRYNPIIDLYGDPCVRVALLEGDKVLAKRLAWGELRLDQPCNLDLVQPSDMMLYDKIRKGTGRGFKIWVADSPSAYFRMPFMRQRDTLASYGARGDLEKLEFMWFKKELDHFQFKNMWFTPAAENGHLKIIEWAVKCEIIDERTDCSEIIEESLSHGYTNILQFLLKIGLVSMKCEWSNFLCNAIESKSLHTYKFVRDYIMKNMIICYRENDQIKKPLPLEDINWFFANQYTLDTAIRSGIIEIADEVKKLFCKFTYDAIYSDASISLDMIQWCHDNVYPVSDFEFQSVMYARDYRRRFRDAEKLHQLGCSLNFDSLVYIVKNDDLELCKWLQMKGHIKNAMLEELYKSFNTKDTTIIISPMILEWIKTIVV